MHQDEMKIYGRTLEIAAYHANCYNDRPSDRQTHKDRQRVMTERTQGKAGNYEWKI